MLVGGAKWMVQKSGLEGLRTYISLANKAITKAEVIKAEAEKDVARLTQSAETKSPVLYKAVRESDTMDEEMKEVVACRDKLKRTADEA